MPLASSNIRCHAAGPVVVASLPAPEMHAVPVLSVVHGLGFCMMPSLPLFAAWAGPVPSLFCTPPVCVCVCDTVMPICRAAIPRNLLPVGSWIVHGFTSD